MEDSGRQGAAAPNAPQRAGVAATRLIAVDFYDQAKSVLAAIGVAAIVMQALRLAR
jgi:hypothetical protein